MISPTAKSGHQVVAQFLFKLRLEFREDLKACEQDAISTFCEFDEAGATIFWIGTPRDVPEHLELRHHLTGRLLADVHASSEVSEACSCLAIEVGQERGEREPDAIKASCSQPIDGALEDETSQLDEAIPEPTGFKNGGSLPERIPWVW